MLVAKYILLMVFIVLHKSLRIMKSLNSILIAQSRALTIENASAEYIVHCGIILYDTVSLSHMIAIPTLETIVEASVYI